MKRFPVIRLICLVAAVVVATIPLPAKTADPEVTRLVRDGQKLLADGDYAAAERMARQATDAAKRLAADDVASVYADLLLGNVLQARADYPGARASFEQALGWLEQSRDYGPDHPAVAAPLVNLANVLVLDGNFPQAEQFARRAVAVNERHPDVGPKHPQTALSTHALAGVLDAKGDFAGSIQLLDRTFTIKKEAYGADSPEATRSLGNLAGAYYEQGDYAKAAPLHDRILSNVEKHQGPNHPETAIAVNNAARLYRAMGLYERAEPLQRRAGDILERVFPPEHPRVAHMASNLGELLLSVGEQAEARKLFERSATVRDKVLGPTHPYTNISWQNLAFAAAGSGDWAAALDAADRGRRGVRRYVARVLPTLTDREQLQFLKLRDEVNLHGILSLGLVRANDPDAAERSAAWVANAKAVGQEATAEAIQIARRAKDPAAHKAAADLQAIRKEIAGLRQAAEQGVTDQSTARLEALEQKERAAILALGLSFDWLEREDPWVTIGAIRTALPATSVFVDIARFRPRDFAFAAREGERFEPYGAPRYVAWVVPPAGRGGIRVVDLGEAAGIDALVAEYRDRIEAAKGPEGSIRKQGEAAAQAELAVVAAPLAKRTIEPLLAAAKEALGKDPEELVISPDGPLWLVPFAALVLADGRFAVEAVAVRHVTSGRDLLAKRPAPGGDTTGGLGRPLIMAAPNFDSQSAGRASPTTAVNRSLGRPVRPSRRRLPPVEPLPGTLEEARSVAEAVRRIAATTPDIVVADEATETRFKAAQRPALAVLATHGFFLDKQEFDADALAIQQAGDGRGLVDARGDELENPLTRCGLMFAGCNRAAGDGEDGVLTGLEILGCDLRGTRLVVLSACQTGLGKVESGEGVAGLRQAFQLAGAETVVSTLWSVPDKETAQLSNAMFTALADNTSPAQAVREAQLAVIRSRTELLEASHPFYWAAFTVTGR